MQGTKDNKKNNFFNDTKDGFKNEIKYIRENVKKRDYKTLLPSSVWFIVRFCIYGCFGMVNEIIFTDFIRMINKISFLRFLVNGFLKMNFPPNVPSQVEQMSWNVLAMFSMTSFWLFFVYAWGFMNVEFVYRILRKTSLYNYNIVIKKNNRVAIGSVPEKILKTFIRLSIFTLIIFITEYVFGWIYKGLFKMFIWEYDGILKTTTVLILPSWFIASYFVEKIVQKFSESDIENAFITNNIIEMENIIKKKKEDRSY